MRRFRAVSRQTRTYQNQRPVGNRANWRYIPGYQMSLIPKAPRAPPIPLTLRQPYGPHDKESAVLGRFLHRLPLKQRDQEARLNATNVGQRVRASEEE
jgi:hypothetical protein